MLETNAAAVAEYAPPDCAICERSLLVGEALRLFRDRESRLVKVCELCRDKAVASGFETLGAYDAPRLRVQASGSISDIVDRDALIEGLGNELAYLKQQLGVAESALSEHSLQDEAVRAITDRLRRQERELEGLRQQADPDARAEAELTIKHQGQEINELRDSLRIREQQVARLQQARLAECDPRAIAGHSLDAFNASEHADRMMRIARTLGDPAVTVQDFGPSLPRKVQITLVWDIAWYSFTVKLDIGAGKASVQESGNGGDPRTLSPEQRVGNARWRASGLVIS